MFVIPFVGCLASPADVEVWVMKNFAQNVVPPFSFTYDGKHSSQLLPKWKFAHEQEQHYNVSTVHIFTWSDPETKLEVRCECPLFSNFPAVEWVLKFKFPKGAGEKSPMLEDVKALDLKFVSKIGKGFVLHRSLGSNAQRNDFAPVHEELNTKSEIKFAPIGGRSSNTTSLPFFNIEAPKVHSEARNEVECRQERHPAIASWLTTNHVRVTVVKTMGRRRKPSAKQFLWLFPVLVLFSSFLMAIGQQVGEREERFQPKRTSNRFDGLRALVIEPENFWGWDAAVFGALHERRFDVTYAKPEALEDYAFLSQFDIVASNIKRSFKAAQVENLKRFIAEGGAFYGSWGGPMATPDLLKACKVASTRSVRITGMTLLDSPIAQGIDEREIAFPPVIAHSRSGRWEIVAVTPIEGGVPVANPTAEVHDNSMVALRAFRLSTSFASTNAEQSASLPEGVSPKCEGWRCAHDECSSPSLPAPLLP